MPVHGEPARAGADGGEPCRASASPTPSRWVSAEQYSLRVTLDAACKEELDQLVALLSHKTRGDLAATLREAIRCGIQKHGQRKGAVKPARERKRKSGETARPFDPRAVPLAVRREVWQRDGGRCAWRAPDGKRCGSRWKVELDHVEAAALGGPPTVDNLRLACQPHNLFHAVRTFGREHMAPFLGDFTPAGGSHEP